MSSILLVTSSPRAGTSISTRTATKLAERLAALRPGTKIAHRDLVNAPLPHIDGDFLGGLFSPQDERSAVQQTLADFSDQAVEELLAADTVVIGAGMINFSIPSALKSWFDYVARAGKTFRYSESGPEGLVKGKRVYVILASKGIYTNGGPAAPMDHARPYLKTMLGFLGMTDVEFIDIEGVGLGLEPDEDIIGRAENRLDLLTDPALAA
ncbi:FMN-dependent NADH-azoreductase [Ochrobactrum daejeonense]|uniref:FMN dependent NADH:quinone oxidoreductase n=1 Tax=Brucella daejeonensis TaxID=659015 RepID=A0A7W9AYP2_9HYPH|nr:FMN-dependent NADH-azoreductase [Brucella daejeonensis]MBB5703044.1 FMN-dependent NADH-azoreductase [Brucella daejeonensis]